MKKKQAAIFSGVLLFIILIAAYYLSAVLEKGIDVAAVLEQAGKIRKDPFADYWNANTPLFLLLGVGVGIWQIAYILQLTGNFMFGREYGSAKWGNIKAINKRLAEPEEQENHILSENLRMSYNPKRSKMNNNQVIIGGSGRGKGFQNIYPNVTNCHGAYVITDAKGDTLNTIGSYMEYRNYTVRVIDLIDFEKSLHYNPFAYLREEEDVSILVDNIMANTKGNDKMGGDQFWEDGPKMLLISIFDYVWYECPKSERNWTSVFKFLDMVTVNEEKNAYERLIDYLESNSVLGGSHPAVKNYKIFKSGAQETMQSILAILYARLQCFRLEKVQWLTAYDECDLYSIGLGVHGNPDKKVAFFILIPDETVLYSPIVGMLYTQLFQILFAQARKCGGALPFDVGFYLDEYPNIKMPGDFIREIATIRSRRIYAKIFIQSISQMKSLHEKDWETIFGNADTMIYLGSGEKGSYEYVSGLLGEFTLNKRSSGKTYGSHGSTSSNVDSLGRKLMTEDELRKMDKEKCIVLLAGENPVMDKKYQTGKCERYKKAVELGCYDLPDRAVRNGMHFQDLEQVSLEPLEEEEIDYYRKQKESGASPQYIILDEDSFLQMHFDEEPMDEEEIRELMEQSQERIREIEEEQGGAILDLSVGTAYDWINRYPLDPEQMEEIIQALEDGMTDEEIRTFYDPDLTAKQMNQMRRLLMLSRKEAAR